MNLSEWLIKHFPGDWLSRVLLLILVLLGGAGSVHAASISRRMVAATTISGLPGDPVVQRDRRVQEDVDPDLPEFQPTLAPGILLPEPDPWDGTSRVNILILGLDLRDDETVDEDAPLSDTMILLSMDPLNNTASAIAIPRDMWVPVPGFGYYKINTSFRLGTRYNVPGGGPALASRTVEEFLGVPVHYYVQLDFQGFVDFVDHMGGVKITFDEPYTLDRRGRWNKVTLEPGTYALPGEYVLAYARDRSTEGHDFDRSARQLEVILLIRERILEFEQLPNLVMNAPLIYEDLSAHIRTNLTLADIIRLSWRAYDIPRENIAMVVIGPNQVSIGKSPDGLDILRPIPDRVRLLRDEVLGVGAALAPAAEGDLLMLVAEENARITVLNGSAQQGLEAETAAWLRDLGFNVVEEGTAQPSTVSEVTQKGPAPYALRWLVESFEMAAGRVRYDFSPDGEIDLVLLLGDDWAANNLLP